MFVVVGVTGGIAAYKTGPVVRTLAWIVVAAVIALNVAGVVTAGRRAPRHAPDAEGAATRWRPPPQGRAVVRPGLPRGT